MKYRDLSLFVYLSFLSVMTCYAQTRKELQIAYAKNSEALLDSFLVKSAPKLSKQSKVTDTIVDGLLHALLKTYVEGITHSSADSMKTPGGEKFIIVQPQVTVSSVAELDSATIFKRFMFSMYSEERKQAGKNVYSPFISPGLFIFKDVKETGTYEVNPNMKMVYQYKPLVVDTSAIYEINDLLKVNGVEHVRVSAFLKKDVKLYPSMYTITAPGYGLVRKSFFKAFLTSVFSLKELF